MEEEKYQLYDNMVASSVLNIVGFSQRTGMIILNNFDADNKKHLYILNTAIIAKMYTDIHRDIYLVMPLFKYLKFKFKNRKKCKLHRYNEFFHKSELNDIINIEEVLQYMADAFEVDIEEFDKIYDEYYIV